MALLGLPTEVVGGCAAGISASFFTLFELENDSSLAKVLFKSKKKAIITSTVCSIVIGVLIDPLSGLAFELIFYPACWIKVKRVQKTLQKLSSSLQRGESAEILYDKVWHKITKLT